jgi:hypothetical protein
MALAAAGWWVNLITLGALVAAVHSGFEQRRLTRR